MANMTRAQIATVVRKAGFPETTVPIAVAVALAESGGNPNATHTNSNGSHDYGLFQINSVHATLLASHKWSDPQQNADMAYQIWKDAGKKWTPWATYNHGSYRKFLGTVPASTGTDTNNSQNSAGNTNNSADALSSPISTVTGAADIMTQLGSTTFWKRVGIGALAVALIIVGIIIVFRQPIVKAGETVVQLIPAGKGAGMAVKAAGAATAAKTAAESAS